MMTTPRTARENREDTMKKSARQLDRDIAEALKSKSKSGGKRVSHAKKKAKTNKTSDKIDVDQIVKLFGLPKWDDVDERNSQYYWEAARGAEDYEEAEQEVRDELYRKWYDAVTGVAERLFEEHGLELDPAGKDPRLPYTYKVVPFNSWEDAADKIRETINGVGYVGRMNNLHEFLDYGSYKTARQAVLSHLGAIRDYPAVYGGQGANQMYQSAMG